MLFNTTSVDDLLEQQGTARLEKYLTDVYNWHWYKYREIFTIKVEGEICELALTVLMTASMFFLRVFKLIEP